jgi:ABC-2 type transport system permease protein
VSMDAIPAQDQALSLRSRPKPASALSAVITLAWRALLKIKHVPFQLFDVTVTPIMFTLLFTFMFGGELAGSPRAYIQSCFRASSYRPSSSSPCTRASA